MLQKQFHFITVWHFDAPVDSVWQLVNDVERIPSWWPGIRRTRLLGGRKSLGKGVSVEIEVRGFWWTLGFTLIVVDIESPWRIVAESSGDLKGRGVWLLTPDKGGTRAECRWQVNATGFWLNLLGTVLEPVARYSHDRVMARGGRAIARLVGNKNQGEG